MLQFLSVRKIVHIGWVTLFMLAVLTVFIFLLPFAFNSAVESPDKRVRLFLDSPVVVRPATSMFSGLVESMAEESSVGTPHDLFRHHPNFEHTLSPEQRLRLINLKSRSLVAADPKKTDWRGVSSGEFYVTLRSSPSAELRQELFEEGVVLVEHLTRKTWRASVADPERLSFIDSLIGVEIGWPVDKWSERLWGDYTQNPDGSLEAVVSFVETVSIAQKKQLLLQAGMKDLSQPGSGELSVSGSFDDLLSLSSNPLVRYADLPAPPNRMNNANAAILSQADDLFAAPYSLTGTNISVLVRDGGEIALHPDFGSRVTRVDTNGVQWHSTHVAGTIGGSGAGYAPARGMAPLVHLYSYDFYGDLEDELQDGWDRFSTRLSNHSYGHVIGWNDGGWTDGTSLFGDYSSYAAALDAKVYDEGFFVIKSAGNDRNDSGTPTGTEPDHDGTLYGDGEYYDCMEDVACAKNIITVGAVDDDATMSTFSNFGPTDDGRIKPDVVANGISLVSTTSETEYGSSSGTSMSAPAVTGVSALLLEQYRVLHAGAWPSAAYLKGLLIHTAEDLGRPGPDYAFGWGLVDAKAAADLIRTDADTGGLVLSGSLAEGGTNSHSLILTGPSSDLKATLCWLDPEGNPAAADALVNDLDIILVSPEGAKTYPYVLPFAQDGSSPTNVAVSGTNRWDTVEQIEVSGVTNGTWTIEVRAETVPSGTQDYVLFVTGGEALQPKIEISTSPLALTSDEGGSDSVELVISNSGLATLEFSLSQNSAKGNYSWVDSSMPNGPVYDWIDITGVGASGYVADDGVSTLFDIGFQFPFYNSLYSQYSVGGNGGIGFSVYGFSYLNSVLPSAGATPASILPFWDDLNSDNSADGSGLLYFHSTTSRLVVTYEAVPRYGTTEYQTFQAILYPDGRIVFQYNDMNGSLDSCTVGLQENGTAGRFTQVVFDGMYVENNLAVEFTPPQGWIELSSTSGSLAPGSSTSIWITASTSNVNAGVYTAQVSVASNDSETPAVSIPASFSVIVPDEDSDGLPDSWEALYYGGATNADPAAVASNGINTVEEAYVAGISPVDPFSKFVMTQLGSDAGDIDRYVLQWDMVSNRLYTIYWASNLFSTFELLTNNITTGAFTDTVHTLNNGGFYRIDVDLAP